MEESIEDYLHNYFNDRIYSKVHFKDFRKYLIKIEICTIEDSFEYEWDSKKTMQCNLDSIVKTIENKIINKFLRRDDK